MEINLNVCIPVIFTTECVSQNGRLRSFDKEKGGRQGNTRPKLLLR